jgi:hypothetical protein
VTMQVSVRGYCTVIAAPIQCDVDGVPKGSHFARVPTMGTLAVSVTFLVARCLWLSSSSGPAHNAPVDGDDWLIPALQQPGSFRSGWRCSPIRASRNIGTPLTNMGSPHRCDLRVISPLLT